MGSDYETLPPPPGAPGGIGAESESTDGSLEQPMAANIQDKIPFGVVINLVTNAIEAMTSVGAS